MRETMLTWEPIHPNHAVERLRFEILFSEPLPRKIIEAVGAVFDAKRSDLRFDPREERQVQHFFVGPNPGIMPQEPMIQNGWQSIRKSAANIPLEAVTFDSSNIVYESTDYRGWQKAFVRFESVCSDMLKAAGEAVNARAIVHDYVDRFVYDGPAGEAVPTEIVRKEFLPQFPKTILMGEELWHSHRGWFEYFDGETKNQ